MVKPCIICQTNTERHAFTCSNACARIHTYNQYIERWKNGLERGLRGKDGISNYLRKFILNKYDHKCAQCGWNKVNEVTKKSPLQIDHIDGNWQNNSEENLILLCPNCHSLTPTYGNLNKGNGRKARYSAVVAQSG